MATTSGQQNSELPSGNVVTSLVARLMRSNAALPFEPRALCPTYGDDASGIPLHGCVDALRTRVVDDLLRVDGQVDNSRLNGRRRRSDLRCRGHGDWIDR